MYESRTRDVIVRVEPEFLNEQSSHEDNRYIWAYSVEIENQSKEELQVVKRFWRIADRNGQVQEMSGEGVVGEMPTLKPGETFRYTSGAPLAAPSGMMMGSYGMKTLDGEHYDVDIPAFSLDSPFEPRNLN